MKDKYLVEDSLIMNRKIVAKLVKSKFRCKEKECNVFLYRHKVECEKCKKECLIDKVNGR